MFVASEFFWRTVESLSVVPAEGYSRALRERLVDCEPEQVQLFGNDLCAGIEWFERTAFLSEDDRFIGSAKEAAIVGLLARGRSEVEQVAQSTAIVVSWDVEPFLNLTAVVDDAYEDITGQTPGVSGTVPHEGPSIDVHIADEWLPSAMAGDGPRA